MLGTERPVEPRSDIAKSDGHEVFFAVVIIATTVQPLVLLNSAEEITSTGLRFFTSIS